MGAISNLFGYILNFIYQFIQNYGVSIILFSILLKLILLPLSIKQQKTMKKTAKIQVKVKEIQEKYKNDQIKMNQEMMDLYKKENVKLLSEYIKVLNKREKEIIMLRFFKEKTQTQVAKILGITQVQVSRIERKVLNNMKLKLTS